MTGWNLRNSQFSRLMWPAFPLPWTAAVSWLYLIILWAYVYQLVVLDFFVPNYANFISTLIARMHHGTSGQHRKMQVNPHGSLWSNYVLFDLCLKWWYVNVLSCVCRIWCSFLPFGLYWPCHFWKYPSWYFSGHLSCFSSDRYFLQDFSRFYHNLLLVHCRSYFLPLESISSVCTLL